MSIVIRDLADLKKVRQEIKTQAQEKALAAKKKAQQDAQKLANTQAFASAMSELGVRPIRAHEKAQADTKKAKPTPQVRYSNTPVDPVDAHHGAHKLGFLSDELDGANFIADPKGAGYYRRGLSPDLSVRLARGEWESAASLDLHNHTADEARQRLLSFIARAQDREYRSVVIIHGKSYSGQGRLSILVPRWLKQIDAVMAYTRAGRTDGDDGALRVLLHVRKFDDTL